MPTAAVYSKPVMTSLQYGNGRSGRRPRGYVAINTAGSSARAKVRR